MELSITLLLQSVVKCLHSFEVQSSEGALRWRSMAYFSVVGYTCVLVHLPKLRWLRHFRHPFCSWSPADVIFVDFDGDGAGTWYIRKEDVGSLPSEMVFANGVLKETWSQHRLCVDRATSKFTWTHETWTEKWIGGQSSDYAEATVGNDVMVWFTRGYCEMWMCVMLEPNVISINRPITSCKRRRQWFLTRMPWIDVKLLGGIEPLCRGCITL